MKWRTALLDVLRAVAVPAATALVAPAVDRGLLSGEVGRSVLALVGALFGL